ncbi:hypothetical protein NUW58_g6625 [Xylaria curta]|uniref:Uncharacterized protein n=1 Tax=Xylaria curta TaxID=42375 RepID=A0ACC1NQW8_9PEZI|nr:hypothetical protein NUW58_g6625 [Xylaria curta]
MTIPMATPENGHQAKEIHDDAEPQVSAQRLKEVDILDACERRDVDELAAIAIAPGGFLSDRLRSQAWPILLGFDAAAISDEPTELSDSWRQLPRHRDEEQVKLDVDRSFVYYPNGTSQTSCPLYS